MQGIPLVRGSSILREKELKVCTALDLFGYY